MRHATTLALAAAGVLLAGSAAPATAAPAPLAAAPAAAPVGCSPLPWPPVDPEPPVLRGSSSATPDLSPTPVADRTPGLGAPLYEVGGEIYNDYPSGDITVTDITGFPNAGAFLVSPAIGTTIAPGQHSAYYAITNGIVYAVTGGLTLSLPDGNTGYAGLQDTWITLGGCSTVAEQTPCGINLATSNFPGNSGTSNNGAACQNFNPADAPSINATRFSPS